MDSTPTKRRLAYLCTDLLFTSKIRETALGIGFEVLPARDPDAFLQKARGAAVVILDLRLSTAIDALRRLRGDLVTAAVPAIGFCDHEKIDLMAEARAAGCTHVLAKGKFSSDLGSILSK